MSKIRERFKGLQARLLVSYLLIILLAIVGPLVLINQIIWQNGAFQINAEHEKIGAQIKNQLQIDFAVMHQLSSALYSSEINKLIFDDAYPDSFSHIQSQLFLEERIKMQQLLSGMDRQIESTIIRRGDQDIISMGNKLQFLSDEVNKMIHEQPASNQGDKLLFRLVYDPRIQRETLKVFYLSSIRNGSKMKGHQEAVLIISFNKDYLESIWNRYLDSSQTFYLEIERAEGEPLFLDPRLEAMDENDQGKQGNLMHYFPMEEFSSALLVYTKETDIWEKTQYLSNRINILIVLLSIVVFLASFIISKRVTIPISTLNRFIETAAKDSETYIVVKSDDEIGRIAQNMNKLKRRLIKMSSDYASVQLESQRSRYRLLQAQINPHFLYNTLNNIYFMAYAEGSPTSAELTKKLSDILHYNFRPNDDVPLQEECDYVKTYMEIIAIRHGNRVKFSMQLDEKSLALKIPRLSLQPVVENAVMHGLGAKKNFSGEVSLSSTYDSENQSIEILIRDNGVGISKTELDEIQASLTSANRFANESIGLRNIYQRLNIFFGDCLRFSITSTPGLGTEVKIVILKTSQKK